MVGVSDVWRGLVLPSPFRTRQYKGCAPWHGLFFFPSLPLLHPYRMPKSRRHQRRLISTATFLGGMWSPT